MPGQKASSRLGPENVSFASKLSLFALSPAVAPLSLSLNKPRLSAAVKIHRKSSQRSQQCRDQHVHDTKGHTSSVIHLQQSIKSVCLNGGLGDNCVRNCRASYARLQSCCKNASMRQTSRKTLIAGFWLSSTGYDVSHWKIHTVW